LCRGGELRDGNPGVNHEGREEKRTGCDLVLGVMGTAEKRKKKNILRLEMAW